MLARLHFGWFLTAILALSLMLRLAAGMWWQQRLPAEKKFGFGDSESYWELGRTIARGQPFEYGPDRLKIFRTPGYPAILAPLFLMSNEPPVFWGRAVSAILSTLAVAAVAVLALVLFDRATALVAAATAAVYPEAIALGAFVLSEAPFTPLMMLNLIFWALAWRRPGKALVGWSLAAGIAGGLATLMRPSWLLFLPFAALIGFAAVRDTRKHAVVCLVMLISLCLTLLPWWARNYRIAGRFVPTTLQVGASLYDGISPMATGASDMRFVGQFVTEQRVADAQLGADTRGLFEDRLDARMRRAAIEWARNNPRTVLSLVKIKLARMWSPVPNANEFQSPWLRLILALTYTPVIVIALIGAWRFVRRDWPYLLCVLPAFYFTCLHVIFVSSIRYRQPATLPLIVLAAAVLTDWIKNRLPPDSCPLTPVS
jgi:4-amino-4-deoxy-L-arabinose transferase-like glycosyltransferase